MSNKNLLYLSSPFSHSSPIIKVKRYESMLDIMAFLLDSNLMVVSPLMLNVPLTGRLNRKGTDWQDWREYDLFLLSRSDELWILTLEGWEESKGVRAEIKYALRHKIPITLINTERSFAHFTYDQQILELLNVTDGEDLND